MQPNPNRGFILVIVTALAYLLRDHDDTAALLLRLANAEEAGDVNQFTKAYSELFALSPLLEEMTK